MARLKASRAEFNRLVSIFQVIPFHGTGMTVVEIHRRSGLGVGHATMAGILETQISRGWVTASGRGEDRRYVRVIWDPQTTLAELVDIV